MQGPQGPFQTSITVNVKNLVVTSDEHGNILQPERRWGVLAAANYALYKTAGRRSKPHLGTGKYSGVIIVEGPSLLGARPYSVYFAYQPHINPANYYISPAKGGRDDRTLRMILTSSLYP